MATPSLQIPVDGIIERLTTLHPEDTVHTPEKALIRAQIIRELAIAHNSTMNSLLMARDHHFNLVENPYAHDRREMARLDVQIRKVIDRIGELLDVPAATDEEIAAELKVDEEPEAAAKKVKR